MIERYRHDDADQCFGKDFIAVDPGKDGACVVVVKKKPVEIIPTALDVNMVAEAMVRHHLELMIMERQFVGRNPGTAIEQAWSTGMFVGAVAVELGNLHMVEVYPSTWQSHQRKQCKISNKLNRQQGIQLAIDVAKVLLEPLWRDQVAGARKSVIEGISSALGMAEWWLGAQHGE